MKHLKDLLEEEKIIEARTETSFNIDIDNKNKAYIFLKNRYHDIDKNILKNLCEKCFELNLIYSPFRFSTTKVKLARIYQDNENFINYCISENFKIVNEYLILNDKTKIQFGNGSIGKINTVDQENASCDVFNLYITGREYIDKSNKNDINKISQSLTYNDGQNFPKDWINSLNNQLFSIVTFLQNQNLKPSEYKMTKMNSSSLISNLYKNFLSKYAKLIRDITKKQYTIKHIDPSDAILYKNHKGKEIKEVFGFLMNLIKEYEKDKENKDIEKIKIEFFERLIKTGLLFGISLKKIGHSQYLYDKINYIDNKRENTVTSFNIENNGKYVTIECNGDFTLKDISDLENNKNDSIKKLSKLFLIFRSFGKGIIAMELKKEYNGIPLGKVPKRIWQEVLELNDSETTDLKICINRLTNKKLTNKDISEFIDGGLKYGGYCLPYILIS